MALVITKQCQGTCDTGCVDVCPADCIHGPVPLAQLRALSPEERAARHPGIQLFINPEECIDCFACFDECPVSAIYHEDDLPDLFRDDARRNAEFFENKPAT